MDDRDPFAEGTEAFHSGQSETSNPYDFGSDDYLSWNDAFNAARETEAEDEP